MPFETINEKMSIATSLFQTSGSFAEHADNVVKSILLKDKSLMKQFQDLKSIAEQVAFLKKNVENFDFIAKHNLTSAIIERDLTKVSFMLYEWVYRFLHRYK